MNMSDIIFRSAILVSLMLHVGFIAYFSRAEARETRQPVKSMEVVYYSSAPEVKHSPQSNEKYKDIKIVKEKKKDVLKVDIMSQQQSPFASLKNHKVKDVSKLKEKVKFSKKIYMPKIETFESKRQMAIPSVRAEKIVNPDYLKYISNLRQKIIKQAYKYTNHPDFSAGEVHVSFLVSSRGRLKAVRVVPEKTRADVGVQRLALRSINDIKNTIPPLPEVLNYPELSFNIEIIFEVSQ